MKKHLWLNDEQRSQSSGVQFHTVTNYQAAFIRMNTTQPKEVWLLYFIAMISWAVVSPLCVFNAAHKTWNILISRSR